MRLHHLCVLLVFLVNSLLPGFALAVPSAWAQETPEETKIVEVDFSGYNFSELPVLKEPINIPNDWDNAMGYELGRYCPVGDSQSNCTKLGDLQFLAPEELTLLEISQYSTVAYNLQDTALSAFELIKNQNIGSLVKTIPKLADLAVEDIPAIKGLLESVGILGSSSDETLGELLDAYSGLESIPFTELDLDSYSIADIPYLEETKIKEFEGWKNTNVSEVAGMATMAWSGFKTLRNISSIVAPVDMPYGTAESRRYNTISGSYQEGFSVPCEQECAHVELAGEGAVFGKQWISGKYQKVKGGNGPLGALFGGKEPTGRFPFQIGRIRGLGQLASFEPKMVVWDVNESQGTVETRLFFNHCKDLLFYRTCTPYVLPPGGIPFITYHEKDLMFVGLLDGAGGSTSSVQLPEEYEQAISETIPNEKLSSITTPTPTFVEGEEDATLCGTEKELYYNVLADAFEQIESVGDGKYQAIGVYDCGGICGRALGRYQFMTFHPEVQDIIKSKPGGLEYLERVNTWNNSDSYRKSLSVELLNYFSVEEQNRFFKKFVKDEINQASRQIDPRTGKSFTGKRLIERVGQIHYGGSDHRRIDSTKTDALGAKSVYQYGVEFAGHYNRMIASGGAKDCCSGNLIKPANGTKTSGYGIRWGKMHNGVDIAASVGTPVVAADGGEITSDLIDNCPPEGYYGSKCGGGFGNRVYIKHCNGWITRYAHLNKVLVKVGQRVSQGQQIGELGNSGSSTGAHLHFEVVINGNKADPEKHLPKL